MFKKLIAVFLLTCSCLFSSSLGHASNDPYYDAGAALGNALGNALVGRTPGIDDKDEYKNQDFNFRRIKRIMCMTNVDRTSQYVSNPYIDIQYYDIINKSFSESKVGVDSFLVAAKTCFSKYDPNYVSRLSKQEWMNIFGAYVAENYDAILTVNIYAYRNRGSFGDVFLEFYMKDTANYMDIFYIKDMRLNAPRSSKEGMISRITNRFRDKFHKAIEDSPEQSIKSRILDK